MAPEPVRGRAGFSEPLHMGTSPVMMRPAARHTTYADVMCFLLQRGGFGRGRGQPPQ